MVIYICELEEVGKICIWRIFMKRLSVKQSKSISLIGMTAGGIFVLIGITTIIPLGGMFGVVWTLVAMLIMGGHAYSFFSKKGISSWEIDIEDQDKKDNNIDFEAKLRSLIKLKEDGLISEEEFLSKRKDIINQK